MAAKNINVQELRDLIESKKPVLVDFWATWCPHCRKINPAYEQIAEEYAGRLEVVKVDVDQDETLWEELELIPTLRLYMEGKPVDSIVAPQSKAAIEAFLAGVMPKEKKETESTCTTRSSLAAVPADIPRRCTQPERALIRWWSSGFPQEGRWR